MFTWCAAAYRPSSVRWHYIFARRIAGCSWVNFKSKTRSRGLTRWARVVYSNTATRKLSATFSYISTYIWIRHETMKKKFFVSAPSIVSLTLPSIDSCYHVNRRVKRRTIVTMVQKFLERDSIRIFPVGCKVKPISTTWKCDKLIWFDEPFRLFNMQYLFQIFFRVCNIKTMLKIKKGLNQIYYAYLVKLLPS